MSPHPKFIYLSPDLPVPQNMIVLGDKALKEVKRVDEVIGLGPNPAAAHGGSQARGHIGATAASLCHSHSNAGSEVSATHTTAHSNARSLTH